MNKFKIFIVALLIILVSISLGVSAYVVTSVKNLPPTKVSEPEIEEKTYEKSTTYEEAGEEQQILELIRMLKANKRQIGTLESEILQSIVDKKSAEIYVKADKMSYYCQQIMEITYDDIESEYFEYISCFKGYAEAGMKWALYAKQTNGAIDSIEIDYFMQMSDFTMAICDFEDKTLEPLIERKGLKEESRKIVEMIKAGEDTTEEKKQFWAKLSAATDLTEYERILVDDLYEE